MGVVVTQLHVLVVGQHQDDVGPDVPGVAVPLQPGAESVPRQVAGGVAGEGEEEEAAKEQEGEAMEAGGEPQHCHDADADLQSPPQISDSHVGGVGNSLASTWRTEGEGRGEGQRAMRASDHFHRGFYWAFSQSQTGRIIK